MGRPKTVTEEQIIEAAESLVLMGETPSIARVRQELGNKGGGNEIAAVLKEWRETKKYAMPSLLDSDDRKPSKEEWRIFQSLRTAIIDEIESKYRGIKTEAEAKVEAALDEVQAANERALQASRDEQTARSFVSEINEKLSAQIAESEKVRAKLESVENTLAEEREAHKANVDDLISQKQQAVDELGFEISDLEAEKAALKKKVDQEIERSKVSEDRWATQISLAQEEAKRLQKELNSKTESLNKAVAELREKLAVAVDELSMTRANEQNFAEKLERSQGALSEKEGELKASQSELLKSKGALAESQAKLLREQDRSKQSAETITRLESALSSERDRSERLQNQIDRLLDRLDRMVKPGKDEKS